MTSTIYRSSSVRYWNRNGKPIRNLHSWDRTAQLERDEPEVPEPRIIRKMYRRRGRRFRTSFKNSRRGYGRRPNAGRLALRKVKQLERTVEEKTLYSVSGTMNIPIGGNAIIAGFGPYCVRGDTRSTRDGSKITVKSLAMRININLTALETLGCSVKLMLVYDRRPNKANAGINNMLFSDDFLSAYNNEGNDRGRFQFLTDRIIGFDSTQAHWNDQFFMKKDLNIVYDGNAGTVADVDKGNLLIVALAKDNAAAITVDYSFNIKFVDL